MKTVRFASVVQECGKPEPYTLWQTPDKDPVFKAALRDSRVMTIHSTAAGAKTDHGEVGYHAGKGVELLVFPKPLKLFSGARIIGVKYDLLQQNQPKATAAKPAARKRPARERKPIEPKVIQFPRSMDEKPEAEVSTSDAAGELRQVKAQIRKALNALSKDRPVAAYKILHNLV